MQTFLHKLYQSLNLFLTMLQIVYLLLQNTFDMELTLNVNIKCEKRILVGTLELPELKDKENYANYINISNLFI